jgi:osmotically-inducible protein OsmY
LLDDDILVNAIESELRHDALTAALGIEVEVWDRVVHLRGVVPGYREAQAAESVAGRVDGVGLVADDLEVRAGATLPLPTRPLRAGKPEWVAANRSKMELA